MLGGTMRESQSLLRDAIHDSQRMIAPPRQPSPATVLGERGERRGGGEGFAPSYPPSSMAEIPHAAGEGTTGCFAAVAQEEEEAAGSSDVVGRGGCYDCELGFEAMAAEASSGTAGLSFDETPVGQSSPSHDPYGGGGSGGGGGGGYGGGSSPRTPTRKIRRGKASPVIPLRRGQGTGGGQAGATGGKSHAKSSGGRRGGTRSPKSDKWRQDHSDFQKILRDARRAEAMAPPRSKEVVREEKFAGAGGGMGGMGGKIGFSNETSKDNPFANGW